MKRTQLRVSLEYSSQNNPGKDIYPFDSKHLHFSERVPMNHSITVSSLRSRHPDYGFVKWVGPLPFRHPTRGLKLTRRFRCIVGPDTHNTTTPVRLKTLPSSRRSLTRPCD